MTAPNLESEANALAREIKALSEKIDRLNLSLAARKQKLNRLHTLIAIGVGADLPPDE
jgi:wobble nucleotide-excising tRNase